MVSAALSSKTLDIQEALEEELCRLVEKAGMNDGLKVVWIPDGNNKLSGEVRKKTIYIYEEELDSALEILTHEVIDYLVCQAIQPSMDMVNRLILSHAELVYKLKEGIVEKIRKLCEESPDNAD